MVASGAVVVVGMRAIVKPRRWWAAGLEERMCERERSWPTQCHHFHPTAKLSRVLQRAGFECGRGYGDASAVDEAGGMEMAG